LAAVCAVEKGRIFGVLDVDSIRTSAASSDEQRSSLMIGG